MSGLRLVGPTWYLASYLDINKRKIIFPLESLFLLFAQGEIMDTPPLPIPEYRIERHRYGWMVFGPVPVRDLPALTRLVDDTEGLADGLIAKYYKATLVLASKADSDAWREELNLRGNANV